MNSKEDKMNRVQYKYKRSFPTLQRYHNKINFLQEQLRLKNKTLPSMQKQYITNSLLDA